MELSDFYKNNESDKIMWVIPKGIIGEWRFSFDGVKIFNLFRDFPWKLTKEQVQIFANENPEWAEFFKSRLKEE